MSLAEANHPRLPMVLRALNVRFAATTSGGGSQSTVLANSARPPGSFAAR
jgi:hypothetical protein